MFPFLWFSDIFSWILIKCGSHFAGKKVHFLTTKSRKGKCISHQFHKNHKKSTSSVKGPTSLMRENISPVREQQKSPVRELSQSPVRENQSLVSKTSKKRPGETNDQEKRKNIRPSEEVFNQSVSMPHKQMAMNQNLKGSHRVKYAFIWQCRWLRTICCHDFYTYFCTDDWYLPWNREKRQQQEIILNFSTWFKISFLA